MIETGSSERAAIYATGSIRTLGGSGHAGAGFVIDHPSSPAGRTLSHSVVESDARKNIYDGTAVADADGYARVNLPVWFEQVNRDLRYQLTPIGGPAPNLHVYQTVHQGSFVIGGAQPSQEICWQVTGIRADQWALHHPLEVEGDKHDPPWMELRQSREPEQ